MLHIIPILYIILGIAPVIKLERGFVGSRVASAQRIEKRFTILQMV